MSALFLEGPAGRLEALMDAPKGAPRASVLVAPPHPRLGGTLHTRVVFEMAKAFTRIGCLALRFNFRGAGLSDGTFDNGRGEALDFRAGVDHLARVHPTLPIWACGYSFGSWIALTEGAIDDRVCCLVGVAPPVGEYDYSAVGTCRKPVFLVHGERDQLTPLGAVRRFYAGLDEPKELVVIDGADHGFDGTASQVGDALEELLSDFTC